MTNGDNLEDCVPDWRCVVSRLAGVPLWGDVVDGDPALFSICSSRRRIAFKVSSVALAPWSEHEVTHPAGEPTHGRRLFYSLVVPDALDRRNRYLDQHTCHMSGSGDRSGPKHGQSMHLESIYTVVRTFFTLHRVHCTRERTSVSHLQQHPIAFIYRCTYGEWVETRFV